MADFVPSTIVKVLKDVPLDSTYSDTIKFTSVGAQTAFFLVRLNILLLTSPISV